MLRYFSTLFIIIISVTLIGIITTIGIFYHYGSGLPDYQQLAKYEPPVLSRFYANDGRMYAEYAVEKRLFMPINMMPKYVVQAFISAEDKNFYDHIGIDFISILSAALTNISRIHDSKRPIGASTITQQVARNFLLADISTQVSFERKIKEAILAFRIEQAFTKNHILELYLNEIYLGASSYGVTAAALNYFNKSLDELTIGEAAFLAALPKAPSRYHPQKSPKLAHMRRDYVLRRMYEDGYITEDTMKKEMLADIVVNERKQADIIKADYFAEEVRRELVDKYGEKMLYNDGMAVRTTLDPVLQSYAAQALRQGLISYDRRHGWRGPLKHIEYSYPDYSSVEGKKIWLDHLKAFAFQPGKNGWIGAFVLDLKSTHAVIGLENGTIGTIPLTGLKWARKYITARYQGPVIQAPKDVLAIGDIILVDYLRDPHTHKIRSDSYELVQIPDVSGGLLVMDPHTGRVLAMQGGFSFDMSQFNRATQALRQPGSSFKTFVYLSAFEKGISPSMLIDDGPFTIDLGYGLGTWSPHNYDDKFGGLITLRRAFERSRNTVTVRLTHDYVGIKNVADVVQRLGVIDHMPLMLAMVLGAGETTLLKMVRAIAMIANGGKEIKPTFIDRIQNRFGKTVFTSNPTSFHGSLISMDLPAVLYDHRAQIIDPATAYQMVSIMEGVAARGTGRVLQELNRPIAGKTGTTNDFKDAWFIGFSPDLIVGVYIGFDQPRYMGEHENGSRLAAPIVKNFLKAALQHTSLVPFRVPPGIKLARIDPYTGKPASPGEKGAIWEAFKPQNAVKKTISESGQIIEDTSSQPLIERVDDQLVPSNDRDQGLGGLY